MKAFKEWLVEEESKKQKVCYMVGLMDDCASKMSALQKKLDIKAGEMVKPDEFHCTIRFMKTDKDTQPLIDFLNEQKLPQITATIKSFAKLNDAFVAKLESPEMHKWFDKVNTWMIENGYPKSDYDTFLPHVSFSYETDPKWEIPEFDKKEHGLDLDFTFHFITAKPEKDNGPEYKSIWEKSSI